MPDEIESGPTLLLKKEYLRAIPLLREQHEKYPSNPRIRLQYADALAGAGMLTDAYEHYLATARYYEDNGLTVQAAAVRKKAEKVSPETLLDEYADVLSLLDSVEETPSPEPRVPIQRDRVIANAEKLVAKGKIEPAIKEYELLLDGGPNDVNTLNRIGDLWVRINRNDEAVKVFSKIADHYSEDGFFLKALAIYKKINKLVPSRLDIYAKLADLYTKQGLAMEAKSQYQVLADYYLKHGDPANALAIYRKISELDPNSINVHVKLGDLYSQNNQTTEALKEYGRVGRQLLERGMREEAVQVFKKAIKAAPDEIESAATMVLALADTKDYDLAAEFATSAFQNSADPSSLATRIREVLLGRDEAALAVQFFELIIQRTPAIRGVREALGDLLLRQNDADRAFAIMAPAIHRAMGEGDAEQAVLSLNRILDVDVFQRPARDLLEQIEQQWNEERRTADKLRAYVQQEIGFLTTEPFGAGHRYVPQRIGVDGTRETYDDAIAQLLHWMSSAEPSPLVIFGEPGSGKSTLLRELALRLSRDPKGPQPIILSLRKMASHVSIESLVIDELRFAGWEDVQMPLVQQLLERGSIVLLLDGLDEFAGEYMFERRLRCLNEVIKLAAEGQAKVVLTSRYESGLVEWTSERMRICTLLSLEDTQIKALLLDRWVNETLVRKWFELLQRVDGLSTLCHNPVILTLVAEIDADQLFDGGRTDSDAVSEAEVYRLLMEHEYGKKENNPAPWGALHTIALHLWTSSDTSLPSDENRTSALSSRLVHYDHQGNVYFAHTSLIEWLMALNAAENLADGKDPMVLGLATMSPAMVDYFCDLAGYENARQWAAVQLRDPLISGHREANAREIAEQLSAGMAPALEEIRESEEDRGLGSLQADEHEQKGRSLLTAHKYREAIEKLQAARTVNPSRAARIDDEFGFLLTLGSAGSSDAGTVARLRWCTELWRALTGDITAVVRSVESCVAPEAESRAENRPDASPTRVQVKQTPAQALGEELENVALRLFRQFFTLAEKNEGEFRLELQKLRKQKAGAQFGYDLAFEATVADNANVRCHVECKNYSSSIALKEVADKLIQQRSHGVQIDHWILISPNANPSQDLHHFLEFESKALDFPFDIHVWCPETDVAHFFALEPALYDKFYEHPAGDIHPRDWSAERKSQIIDRYRRVLRPLYRLPQGWREYVENESNLCFSDTEQYDFERAYATSLPLGVRDEKGLELPGTAVERLLDWLADPSQRVAFILGEFGDGKSFLTYAFSRQLLEAFRASPESAVIPLRLALREFSAARSVREFLRARLEFFGADPGEWAALKKSHRTLVILDGFDEISKELDPATITNNIRALIDCCSAPVFDGCKILITSRTHFFETGDAFRLLQRLNGPLLLQLARIPRGQVLGHLQDSAKGPEERQLLERLARMHDPIGLGTKPLFLQMLKDTLHELPADLDEISVYDSYARKSLERKVELLDDPEFRASRNESVQQLLSALGVIAEELQCSKDTYVSLKKLRQRTGPFAELLWRLSGEDRLESDAEARLGTRSLLSRVNALEGDGRWLVDFCHRSIREYFVARQFADCLGSGAVEGAEFLSRVPVNHEILYFTACLLRRSRNQQAIESLRELICGSRVGEDSHALAGRALTVLLRVTPVIPRDIDFTSRNFDFADLEDGDFSGLDFSGSTFKSANFANTNLEDANLSDCDLTGVRLHETTSVLAVAAPSPGRIFAAYDDATVWEWDVGAGSKPSSRIVFSERGLKLSRIGVTRSGVAWAIAGRTVLLFEISAAEWRCIGRLALDQTCADFIADDQSIAMLIADKSARCHVVDLERQGISLELPMPESSVFVAPAPDLLCFRENESAIRLTGSASGNAIDFQIATGNPTSLDVFVKSFNLILVAVGEGDGIVRVLEISLHEGKATPTVLFEERVHSGPVPSIKFSGTQTVVSGGLDRKIALTPLRADAGPSRNLQLNFRCRGLRTDGLRPEGQRMRLEELKSRASR